MTTARLSPADQFTHDLIPILPGLRAAAIRLTRNPTTAEDLLQDATLNAWRARSQYQPGTNFKAWLHRILVNTYISDYRKTQRQPLILSRDGDLDGKVEDQGKASGIHPSAEDEHLSSVTDPALRQALTGLSTEFRTVLYLADVEGWSHAEIADYMGTPTGTVMSRLYRARHRVRAVLAEPLVAA